MFIGSLRLALLNQTSIDTLKRSTVTFIAVRIPLDLPPSSSYPTITYPLSPMMPATAPADQPAAPGPNPPLRDQQAQHRFAILRTEPGENPYNMGLWENFKSVMGHNILEWLLPIAHSPCYNHDSMTSDYAYGIMATLRRRYGLPDAMERRI